MDSTVGQFYTKDTEGYFDEYERSHGPRLDALVSRYNLKDLHGRVLDVGGGMGFLGKRLSPEIDYWIIDGADIPGTERPPVAGYLPQPEHLKLIRDVKLCKGTYVKQDLDHDHFSSPAGMEHRGCGQFGNYQIDMGGQFDTGFVLEVLEHLASPYHCLAEMKKLVKLGGLIYISIPPPSVWHNVIYPGLLWPKENFVQWLGQMALEIVDQYDYQPAPVGWPAWTFVCRNLSWDRKRLLFEKAEVKFRDCTPLAATNL